LCRITRLFYILLLLGAGGLTGRAQAPSAYNFYQLFLDKGLSDARVSAIVQDKSGFMWFATPNGLNRYDGYSIKKFYSGKGAYDLPSNNIIALYSSKAGELWIGTGAGVVQYDFVRERFLHVDTTQKEGAIVAHSQVNAFAEDEAGNIYAGCVPGLFRFNHQQKKWENITQLVGQEERMRNIRRLKFLNNERLYAITTGNLPFFEINIRTNKVDSIHYKTPFADTCCLNMFAIEKINDHELLTGFLSAGIARLDTRTKQYTIVPGVLGKSDSILYNSAYDILKDHTGRIWIASYYYRLAEYLPAENRIVTFEKDPYNPLGFDGNSAICVYEDRQHNIWVGTVSKGVYRFNPNHTSAKFYSQHDFIPGALQTGRIGCFAAMDSTTLVAGSERGFSFWNRKTGQFTNFKGISTIGIDKPLENVMSALTTKDGVLWMGTNRLGLMRYDLKTGKMRCFSRATRPSPLLDDGITDIIELPDKNLLLCGYTRPVLFNTQTFFVSSFRNDTSNAVLKLVGVADMCVGADKLVWLGSSNTRLHTYDPVSQTLTDRSALLEPLKEQVQVIYQLGWHNNTLYIATNAGIVAITKNSEAKLFRLPATADALSEVRGILPDGNEVWFANNSSAGRLDPATGRIIFLGEKDGLTNIQLAGHTLFRTPQGTILIGTGKGFYEVMPRHFDGKTASPNFFSFDVSAFAYHESGDIEYAYMLEGFDKDWQYLSKKRSGSYTNVPGGNYVLKLKTRNASGEWNENGQQIQIHIGKPFTATWWFRFLAIAAVAGIAYAFYKVRINRINKEAKLRSDYEIKLNELENSALRTQMNPHFIFNSLNTINSFINSNDRVQANQYISKFSKLVRLILDHSREKKIILKDELEVAELYMQLEQIRFENRFSFSIDPGNVDPTATEVPPLIIQPFVENAILHGLLPGDRAGILAITINRRGELVQCSIEDNGIGRENAKKIKERSGYNRKSHGMEITLKRIELFNKDHGVKHDVRITDLYTPGGQPAGTRVDILLAYVESF
jgi:ligand-binding sensor domain-containing protein